MAKGDRSLELGVRLQITEKIEGEYSTKERAAQSLTIQLPVDQATLERELGAAVNHLVRQIQVFTPPADPVATPSGQGADDKDPWA